MERAEQIMINAKQYETDMIRWRRKIHIHPEVGFELPGTQRLVKEELERMGLEVQSDFVMDLL